MPPDVQVPTKGPSRRAREPKPHLKTSVARRVLVRLNPAGAAIADRLTPETIGLPTDKAALIEEVTVGVTIPETATAEAIELAEATARQGVAPSEVTRAGPHTLTTVPLL